MIKDSKQREITRQRADGFAAALTRLEANIADGMHVGPDLEMAELQASALRNVRDELIAEMLEWDERSAAAKGGGL